MNKAHSEYRFWKTPLKDGWFECGFNEIYFDDEGKPFGITDRSSTKTIDNKNFNEKYDTEDTVRGYFTRIIERKEYELKIIKEALDKPFANFPTEETVKESIPEIPFSNPEGMVNSVDLVELTRKVLYNPMEYYEKREKQRGVILHVFGMVGIP